MGNISICKSYKYDAPILGEGDMPLIVSKQILRAMREDEYFKTEVTEAIDDYLENERCRKRKAGVYSTSRGLIRLKTITTRGSEPYPIKITGARIETCRF